MADEQLSFIIADLSKFTAEETVALVFDVQANLREDTPRDTSWARSNWIPSVGAPDETPAVTVGRPTPGEIARAAARQASAAAELGTYDLTKGIIFTTNNVPYIIPLNEGHSQQAGAGFVQRSVGRALMERESVSR